MTEQIETSSVKLGESSYSAILFLTPGHPETDYKVKIKVSANEFGTGRGNSVKEGLSNAKEAAKFEIRRMRKKRERRKRAAQEFRELTSG